MVSIVAFQAVDPGSIPGCRTVLPAARWGCDRGHPWHTCAASPAAPTAATRIPWCSGYHICLTRRRPPVRSWAESLVLLGITAQRNLQSGARGVPFFLRPWATCVWVAWPSGLRRCIKAAVPSGAWVRIPPLPSWYFFRRDANLSRPNKNYSGCADRDRTRTCNLRIRSPTPYPLGHTVLSASPPESSTGAGRRLPGS